MTEVWRDTHLVNPVVDLEGKQVRLHWHFQKKKYSVSLRARNGRWYVVRSRETGEQILFGKVVLTNARFVVNPAGARKAYETGKKNVHAWVTGTVRVAELDRSNPSVPCGQDIFYNTMYPEPEFKVIPRGYDYHFSSVGYYKCPGIETAEMLSCGCDVGWKPRMRAAGMVRIKRGF